jgi:hypothetical protein
MFSAASCRNTFRGSALPSRSHGRARGERWLTEAMDAYLTVGEHADLIKAGALLDRIMAHSKAVTPGGRK